MPKPNQQSLRKCSPCRELAILICILEPYEGLALHMKRGHANTLVERSIIVIKKLVHLVRPGRRILTIKAREIQVDGSGMHVPVTPRIINHILLLIPMVVVVIPAILVKTVTFLSFRMVITAVLVKTVTVLPIITPFRASMETVLSLVHKMRGMAPVLTVRSLFRKWTRLSL
jgi:hypothetical protein